jgi:hypothetical protein
VEEDEEVMTTGCLCGVDGSAWHGLDGMWMRSDNGSWIGRGGASVAAASGEAAGGDRDVVVHLVGIGCGFAVQGWSGWESAVVAGGGERHERSGDGRARGEEGGGCGLYDFSFSLFF